MKFDESKGWKWLQIPSNLMQEGEGSSHIKNTLQDDDQEVETEPA